MLTKNEIATLNLSPTKKDFVQIWNELLEVAGRLSERWDPTSTNESDPGIVILKALAGIADKLNYNIDKNTLEAFMPTAAQEDSMRKLCDMLGYNVKYYRSAETAVTIRYYNSEPSDDEKSALEIGLAIPKFTAITNGDQDINYFTTNQTDVYISSTTPSITLSCMEGQIVKCESTSDNNVITASQISERNRFYLPEAQIAENGIFVYNVAFDQKDGANWEKVDNLNIQRRGSRVFKFGYDSYEGRPYIEFPEDYSELINDGLFIYYARTSGANGNISARTLSQLEPPSSWSGISAESFSVENAFAATTGANLETINQAYNSFKKTIGTFETLVTCRDYMNKIYTMTADDTGKPLVSNVLVTDIRNDLNRAITICSCDDAGIFYKDTPLTAPVTKTLKVKDGNVVKMVTAEVEEPVINHFDLVLYPFKAYNQIRGNVTDIQEVYDSSFKYNPKMLTDIKSKLDDYKTIAHTIKEPRLGDVISINNYLRLNAVIGTNTKITVEERTLLVDTIKIALANAFNMRELDFGEEIPFDSIVEVIEKADARIKIVSLAEPALYTTFSVLDGYNDNTPVVREYAVASDWLTEETADAVGRFDYTDGHTFNTQEAKKIYNRLAVRNVLAGRVPLFKYNDTFKTSFSEGAYRTTKNVLEDEIPEQLRTPTSTEPFTIYTDKNDTYTGQLVSQVEKPVNFPDDVSKWYDDTEKVYYVKQPGIDQPVYSKLVYTKTSVPKNYINNIIAKTDDGNNITEIVTSCVINSDKDAAGEPTYEISDVTLAAGETVKFRAPNFTTDRTYPAYVNYHLKLKTATARVAEAAKAYTLSSLLNSQVDGRGLTPDERRQRALNYFAAAGHKHTFTLTQKVLKKTSDSIDKEDEFTLIKIENDSSIITKEKPEDILIKSGFVKLTNTKPTLAWIDGPKNSKPDLDIPKLDLGDSLFIVNAGVFTNIKTEVDEYITYLNTNYPNKLPTEYDWTISYTFEYVPFEEATLSEWKNFIISNGRLLFGFYPVVESETVLWHATAGGYNLGKNVLSNTAKLLAFTRGDFGFLDSFTTRLLGVYVAEDLGSDQKATSIANDEEYMLRSGEKLFIEYTPSTTTEDGASQDQAVVTEVFGEGTIIKPSGFESNLIDSSVYQQDYTPPKKVSFTDSDKDIPLFSLGASEQIEIRELAKVTLNRENLPNTPQIYVYKNFNNCPELEKLSTDGSSYSGGKRINSSYTLKDGEYIFYTDQNMTEFAYFTSGTEVTLYGSTVLPQFDIIDLATIFDNGIQEIPWKLIPLVNDNGINFQEYQYVTLGEGDTLNRIFLAGLRPLNESWQMCDKVEYTMAGAKKDALPKINIFDATNSGNGWEACSALELKVSQDTAQTLRKTDKIETKIVLKDSNNETFMTLEAEKEHPVSFKTNLPCQTSSGKLNISDLYTNPNKLKSFELKVFAEETPAIIKTKTGTLIPYQDDTAKDLVDVANWPVDQTLSVNDFGTLWKPVALSSLTFAEDDPYTNALRLSVSTIPNTYGIFSIYLDYRKTEPLYAQTWIELLPGVDTQNVELFNSTVKWEDNKLMLHSGINCIRVNKTSDLFIKTKATDGALYFDSIRLVDCRPVEYIENGNKVAKVTQGLNLSQIGYLDTSDDSTFSVFDSRIRKKLRDELTNSALDSLEERANEESAIFASTWDELLVSKTAMQDLVDCITSAITEIELLNTSNGTDTPSEKEEELIAIFDKYKQISEKLDKEKNLKTALDNNSTVDELERQLADLASSLTNTETERQDLLTKLELVKAGAETNANNFSKDTLRNGDILDDFVNAADIVLQPSLVDDIKFASMRKINTRYGEQLDSLAADIENVLKSEEALNNSLSYLHATKHTVLLEQVEALISTYEASLSSSIKDVQDLAIGTDKEGVIVVDYTALESALNSLKEHISTTGISLLIARIESTADSSLYTELAETIDALKLLLEAQGTNSNIITAIDSVITLVQNKNNSKPDETIKGNLESIKGDISNYYTAKLQIALDSIDNILSSLEDTYKGAKDYLDNQEDAQIKLILSRLENISNTATACLDLVKTFGAASDFNITTDYACLPFGEDAVLTTWPVYMRQALISGIGLLYEYTRNAANSRQIDFEAAINALENRAVLAQAADLKAFNTLFNTAKTLAARISQNHYYELAIADLANLIVPSSELKELLDAENDYVLMHLISEFKDTANVAEQQRLITELKSELDNVIKLDTKLAEISAKLLCPSILLADSNKKLSENSVFFERFLNYAVGKKKTLLTLSSNFTMELNSLTAELEEALATTGSLLNAIKAGDIAQFDVNKWENITTTDESSTLLSEYYLEKLTKLKGTLDIQELITKIKNSKLFDFLKKNFVIAWQICEIYDEKVDGKLVENTREVWIDGAGEYIIQNTGSSWQTVNGDIVELRHYADGRWTDCRNEQEVELIVKSGDSWLIEGKEAFSVTDEKLSLLLTGTDDKPGLLEQVASLCNNSITKSFKDAYSIIILEEQLLEELSDLDKNGDFYYSVPVESNFAIDFNKGDSTANTLMNPTVNYDINNVNNNFVISKIDIDYLTKGLQIAHSSRLN